LHPYDAQPMAGHWHPWTRLSRIFLTGLLAALPLAATIAIFAWGVGLLIRWLGPGSAVGGAMTSIGFGVAGSELVGYAIGVALVAALIFGLGLLVEAGLQRGLARGVDAVVQRIPFVRGVYDLARRLAGLVQAQREGDGLHAMSAVWCHFGGPGGAAALALLGSAEVVLIGGARYLAVLIPTSPVPIGGGLLYVPEAWVTPADVGVEAVTSIYVSMGVTSSQYLPTGGAMVRAPESPPPAT
jgi:uncharacterized membrane protein